MVSPRGKEGDNGLDLKVTNIGAQDQPPVVYNGNPLDHRELAGL
jgi:hypothetical protein